MNIVLSILGGLGAGLSFMALYSVLEVCGEHYRGPWWRSE